MPRTRAKAPPRLTRDAERLIALANGLNASGSLTEDRFWALQWREFGLFLLAAFALIGFSFWRIRRDLS